jgi:hypothetical protein
MLKKLYKTKSQPISTLIRTDIGWLFLKKNYKTNNSYTRILKMFILLTLYSLIIKDKIKIVQKAFPSYWANAFYLTKGLIFSILKAKIVPKKQQPF